MLIFRTIDVDRDGATCIAFSRDAFVCSFGSDERFLAEAGPGFRAHLDALRRDVQREPGGFVHVWSDGEIVGEILIRLPPEEDQGYVSLLYLKAEHRGTGTADELHTYVESYFRDRGRRRLRLSVSPTNVRAIRFYTRHGWKDCGPRPGNEHVNSMELEL